MQRSPVLVTHRTLEMARDIAYKAKRNENGQSIIRWVILSFMLFLCVQLYEHKKQQEQAAKEEADRLKKKRALPGWDIQEED